MANGTVVTDFGSRLAEARSVVLQPDGKMLVAGYTQNPSGAPSYVSALVRYNADGSLDTTFGTGGIVSTGPGLATGSGVVLQADGKIVTSGGVFGSPNRFALTRYNSDGSVDTSFGTGGQVATNFGSTVPYSMMIQPDGKIVLTGEADEDFAVARFNANGSFDTSFGTGGKVTTDFGSRYAAGYAVARTPDGKIVVAGIDEVGITTFDFAVARYNIDGSLDTSFGIGGKAVTGFTPSTSDISYSVTVQADGKIVVSGMTGTPPHSDFGLVRYNVDGSLDTSFGTGGKVVTDFGSMYDFGNSVTLQANGKIVVAGWTRSNFQNDFALARYNSDGSLDTTFGTGGKVTTGVGYDLAIANSVVVQADGKIVLVGKSDNGDYALARYNSNGSLDTSFGGVTVASDKPPTLTATAINPTYVENGARVTLFSGAAASTIEAGQTIKAMTLTVSGIANGFNEGLFIDGTTIALFQGSYIGTATNGLTINVSAVGSSATVTFTGANLSVSAFQNLVNTLGYVNFGDGPTPGNRTFTITQIVDSGSNISPHDNDTALSIASTVGVTAVNDAPLVNRPAGSSVSRTAAETSLVSSLFRGRDPDGDTLTYYLYDANSAANSGHFVVNGMTVPGQTIYELTAAQFAQATFVAGASGTFDDLYVQAYDGRVYSGWDTTVHVVVPANRAPVVTAPQTNVAINTGQSRAVSSLFSASDNDGDTLTYYLYDSNSAANSGRFMINGTAVPAQTIYALTAAQFAQATFVSGAAGTADDILVQAFDGKAYSGWNTGVHITSTPPVNHSPIVGRPAGPVVNTTAAKSLAVSSLFSGSDSDGDSLSYFLYDSNTAANSGHFVVNGVTVPAGSIYALSAAQLAQATFVAGAAGASDEIFVQAFDGKAYSGWTTSVQIAVNRAPVVTAPQANVTASATQSFALSNLFSGSDADGNTLTYYLYDSNAAANSGHFVVNGVAVPAQSIFALTAAQLAQATFVAGAAGTSDDILVQVFDGKEYSGWNTSVHVTVNHAPVLTASQTNVTALAAQSLAFSSLFSASDRNGDALSYYLYDSNGAANSGHFVVNGVTVPAQSGYTFTAAQMAQATFVAGAAGTADDIFVQAFDGQDYSVGALVHVTATAPNNAPTVDRPAGTNIGATAGQTLQLSSLFVGNDLDGDPLRYFVYDHSAAANSGHVEIGGNVVAAQTITAMTAAQLAQATFIAGDAGTADDIFVQAFDGKAYSGWATGVHIFV